MFYLTMHSTFYLQLYGVRHMVKDHSDTEKGNPLPPHRLLLSIIIHSLDYSCHVTKHHSMHHHWKTHETNEHYRTQMRLKKNAI